jgi:hydrogenase maturation protein HypF
VHRTARAHGLSGWIRNERGVVHIEVQGAGDAVRTFTRSVAGEVNDAAIEETLLADREESTFQVFEADDAKMPSLPTDLVACPSCLAELGREDSRRFRYPFTNCAACGPRWSISTAYPYDRRFTSMRSFTMCGDCAAEYDDRGDRRHRAQPIACPNCGPELSFLGPDGGLLANGERAITAALALLASSGIIAVRGLGGFELLCDATDAHAVGLLRVRKNRPDKPFPVMFRDRAQLEANATISEDEWSALAAAEGPIVLVNRRQDARIDEKIGAHHSPWVGSMLPSTPLHALLLNGLGRPLVCTSGNRAGEPQCTKSEHAVATLAAIADGFLDHDRAIVRPLESSVVRATSRRHVVLRRARGYAPRSVGSIDPRATVLALGAQQRSTVTLGHRGVLVPSQHLGDLDSPRTCELLEETVRDLCSFFDVTPSYLACDQSSGHASSSLAAKLAAEWRIPLTTVQHHHAHVAAGMAEHELGEERKVLGLVWDGPAAGDDGRLWGGEALVCRGTEMERTITLASFPILGGDRPFVDPQRAALGLLFEHLPEELLARTEAWTAQANGPTATELDSCLRVLERRLAPMCSSVSRLFDGVAGLIGICQRVTFEGQAAMELEHLAASVEPDGAYPFPIIRDRQTGLLAGDTRALVAALLEDVKTSVDPRRISRRFHEALIGFGVAVAEHAGIPDVIASGECFQNHLLVDGLEERLERAGFRVFVPTALPANDGCVSAGQAWLAAQLVYKAA